MPTIRERMADLLLGDQRQKLAEMTRTLVNAYLAGPFEMGHSPEDLRRILSEFDSSLIQDLVHQIEWERLGVMGYDPGEKDRERVRAVLESRRLWELDVVSALAIQIWTDFGFGENVKVLPSDPAVAEVWDEFWGASRNDAVLAADNLHQLSETLLVDGDLFLAYYISTVDGAATLRKIDALEITQIITHPDDATVPLYYKREWAPNAASATRKTMYYPDWNALMQHANDPVGTANPAAIADLPRDASRAETAKEGTVVVVQHLAFRRRQGLRGWPLMRAGAPWSREHRRFRENRAAVAAAVAMYVDKIKAKGGSRAIDALRSRLQSSLASGSGLDMLDRNPPPTAGSTWLENEAAERTRLPLRTDAGDAQVDGNALLMMAGLSAGLYPHWLGAGEAFRLATACYAEGTEILTPTGWKDHLSWDGNETVACVNPETGEQEFHVPDEMLVYDYNGPMLSLAGRGTDALLTPNHRMLVLNENNVSKQWAQTEWQVKHADELPSRFALPTMAPDLRGQPRETFVLPGFESEPAGMGLTRNIPDVTIPINDWLQFLGWWIAEGWLERWGRNHTVGLSQSEDGPETAGLRELIRRMPWPFYEDTNQKSVRWRCNRKALYQWLAEHCGRGSANKRVPGFIFDLPPDQRRVFLDALWAGDGRAEHKEHYRGFLTTVSPTLADDVQRLLIGLGEWGHVVLSYEAGSKTGGSVRTNRDCYVVHRNVIAKRSYARRKNVSRIEYTGKVVCFRVKTGFYLTRRNGCPLIAGNSAMETPMLRQFSRYRMFWSASFRRMARIVMGWHDLAQGRELVTPEVEISADRLIETDLKMLSDSIAPLVKEALVPMYDAGRISDDTLGRILGQIWRTVLQALGSDEPDVIAPDTGFGASPMEEAEAGNRRPFGSGVPVAEASSHESDYGRGINAAARGLWSGATSREEFVNALALQVEVGLRHAFVEGMAAAGFRRDEITQEEWDILQARINQELGFIPEFASWIEANSKAAGGKLTMILGRARLWAVRYLDIVNLGKATAATNPKLRWRLGSTKEHCKDCAAYDGRVYRAATWQKWGAMPQSHDLECGGWKCACKLEPTDDPVTPGRPPSPSGG